MSEPTSPYMYCEQLAETISAPTPDTIISRALLKNEVTDVTLFAFAAGQELTEHSAARPAILHFLEGEGEVGLGGEIRRATAGTWIWMPPRLPHSIRAETDMKMLLILFRQTVAPSGG